MLAQRLNPLPPQTDSLVTIGQILKPFGIRGDVKVESMSDVPGRFEGLETVYLTHQHEGATPLETIVTQVRAVNAVYLVRFSAFSTPEEASQFRGAWVQIPMSSELPREPDTFYQFELIGLRVEDPDGQHMGIVEEILEYPQHHVLVVRNKEAEMLLPASRKTIERVDLDNQCLHVASKECWNPTYAL